MSPHRAPDPTLKRLFFALWPKDAERARCATIAAAHAAGCHKVPSHNLHATLVFLGNVDAQRFQALSAIEPLKLKTELQLSFDRIEFWKKPRIVCLTAGKADPELLQLVEQLQHAARELGIVLDERPYRPHVTLLRKAQALDACDIPPVVWRTDTFCLVQSLSTDHGVRYQVVKSWNFLHKTGKDNGHPDCFLHD